MNSTIEIENCGPVEKISIPIPAEGGIVVLQGRNGSGKSCALEAITSVVTGKGSMEVRDAADKGKVNAFGVTMTVGRSTRRTGELEVSSLEGRLSVADLVDPPVKDVKAADERRIRALVSLAGAKAEPSMFHDVVGGKEMFDYFVKPESLRTDDVVEMADRIKRDLDAAARLEEQAFQSNTSDAVAFAKQVEGTDFSKTCNVKEVQEQLEAALCIKAGMAEKMRSYNDLLAKAAQAAEKLKNVGVHPNAVDKAKSDLESARRFTAQAEESRKICKQALQAAEDALKEAELREKAFSDDLMRLEREASLVEECRKVIDSASPEMAPKQDDLEQAEAAVNNLRKMLLDAEVIGHKKRIKTDMDAATERATKHQTRSQLLRKAAGNVHGVLSTIVSSVSKMRVVDGRLVLDTKRGTTNFADLSDGERWKVGLDVAIDAVGDNGLIVLPQVAYEGLDPMARQEIAEHVRSRRAVVITAEATSDEEIHSSLI